MYRFDRASLINVSRAREKLYRARNTPNAFSLGLMMQIYISVLRYFERVDVDISLSQDGRVPTSVKKPNHSEINHIIIIRNILLFPMSQGSSYRFAVLTVRIRKVHRDAVSARFIAFTC